MLETCRYTAKTHVLNKITWYNLCNSKQTTFIILRKFQIVQWRTELKHYI